MLNPIYQLDIVGQDIHIYNKYNLKNSLFLLRSINNPNKVKDLILNTNENVDNIPLLNRLYKNGVIVEPNYASLISSIRHIIDELEEDSIAKFHLSTILVEKLLASSFTIYNLHQKDNTFLEMLAEIPKKADSDYHHYLVIYQDTEELRSLQQLSLSSNNQTIFLCKYNAEEIAEIGPYYQINHEFCFDCLTDNMNKHRIIHQTVYSGHHDDLLKSQYLYSMIDYFLYNKTWLSSIQERKITMTDDMSKYTTLIHPINPTCTCMTGKVMKIQ